MSNTVIQLKFSAVPGNTPSSLANGEIAINTYDGKFFYRGGASNTIQSITRFTGPAGLDTELQFNDGGLLGGSEKLTFNKTTGLLTVNGTVRANIFSDDGVDIFNFANNAFNTANSKTQVYQQNNAPSIAGATDFWIANTGVMYENFGNTTNPVWAEVGPTSVVANTLPGAITATTITASNTVNITYQPASTIGSALTIVAANTIGGTGYADVLRITNSSAGATTPNKSIRLNQTGGIEIIDSNYGNNILTLTDAGDLSIRGNVTSAGIKSGYNANRPAFRVTGNGGAIVATQTVQGGYYVVDYNQGSYLNTTNGIFTAPVAGLYQVNLVVRTNSNSLGTISQAIIRKTVAIGGGVTTQIMIEFGPNTSMNHVGGSAIVNLAVGDTLKFDVTAGTLSFDGNDNWSVAYIG
jgi:hypothetical protein